MPNREPTPDELLSALEGKALPGDAHDALLRLGRAIGRAAPPIEKPDTFFASRLKAKLATAPLSQPPVPFFALLLPLVGVIAIAAVLFALPRANPATPAASDTAPEVAVTDAAPKVAEPLDIATGVTGLAQLTDNGDTKKNASLTIKQEPAPAVVVPEPKPSLVAVGSITLSGVLSEDIAKLSWKTNSLDVSQGFKVIWNKTGSPVYPGDKASYVDGGIRTYSLKELPENSTVYIRVCQYTGNGCGTYSNQLKLQTGAAALEPIK